MTKHTPGPWRVIEHSTGMLCVVGDNDKSLCSVGYNRTEGRDDIANARLIAAAPEMLAALQFAEPYIDEWIDMFDPSDEADQDVRKARDECRRGLEQLRAAIAKATGE